MDDRQTTFRADAGESHNSDPKTLLHHTLDILGEATIILDEDLRISLVNRSAERLLDRDGASLIGQSVREILSERHQVLESIARRFLRRHRLPLTGRRLEVVLKRGGGEEIPAEASCNCSTINGRPILTVFLRDISARKLARARAELRDNLLRALARFSERLMDTTRRQAEFTAALECLGLLLGARGARLYRHHFRGQRLPALEAGPTWHEPGHECRFPAVDYESEDMEEVLPLLLTGNPVIRPERLLVPLHAHEEWVGLMVLEHPELPSERLHDIRDLLVTAARQIGAAMSLHDKTQALQQSERRYRALFDRAPDLYFILDRKLHILDANATARRQLKRTRRHIFGYPFEHFVHPSDRPRVHHCLQNCLNGSPADAEAEFRMEIAEGESLWVHLRAERGLDETGGETLHLLCRDITSRRLAELALRESQEHYRRTFQIAAVSLWEIDISKLTDRLLPLRVQGERKLREHLDRHPEFLEEAARMMQIVQVNTATLDLMDASREQELLGSFDPRISPDSLGAFREFVLAIGMGMPRFQSEFRCITCSGRIRDVLLSAALPDALPATHMILSMTDITRIKELERQLTHSALHDPLTGLPNRAMFHDRLENALARARRNDRNLALLYIDLDRFKPINDHHGHEAGDEVLREVARRLREELRDSDTLCRHGGDEFLVLLEGLESEVDAETVAIKLRSALEAPLVTPAGRFQVGASIGIAIAPRDARDVEGLIRHADQAMYRAKTSGLGIAG